MNDKTIKAAGLIGKVYDSEGGGAGGHGHIVFDDENIDDDNIDYCLQCDTTLWDYYPIYTWKNCQNALLFFKGLTIQERNSALGIYFDYFDRQITL